MSDKPKTAVQWLIENLDIMGMPLLSDEKELCKQALAMEREQIASFADEYADQVMAGMNKRAKEYYTETYGE